MTPGIGLTSIGIVGVGISLSGIAKTFIDGMHAVTLLTMFIGMIFLASGLLKDGFPTSGRAKSATFVTLGFLVTFGFAAAVTVSTQVPSIFAYIGLMLIISIPATVLAVASYRGSQYLKPLAVIFIGAAIVGGSTFYAFGLVAPKTPIAEEGQGNSTQGNATQEQAAAPAPGNTISARILPGASAEGNPDYEPDPITIKQGDGIQWTNEDNTPHTVTSKQQGLFDSGLIKPADKWLLNSAQISPAEYAYYCTLHPFMGGALVVTSGSAPSGQSSTNMTTTTQGGATNNESGASSDNSTATAADNNATSSSSTAADNNATSSSSTAADNNATSSSSTAADNNATSTTAGSNTTAAGG